MEPELDPAELDRQFNLELEQEFDQELEPGQEEMELELEHPVHLQLVPDYNELNVESRPEELEEKEIESRFDSFEHVFVEKVRPGLFCARSQCRVPIINLEDKTRYLTRPFIVKKCVYEFQSTFVNSKGKLSVDLKLEHEPLYTSKLTKIAVGKNQQPASIIWVPLHEDVSKVYPLERSIISNQWTIRNVPIEFDFKPLDDEASIKKSPEPNQILNFLLLIQFENLSVGQKEILQQVTNMFVRQTFCDVYFLFEENQQIGGHVNILGARSPVFAAMFQHGMTESQTGQVFIKDIELEIFKQMLYYIYAGEPEQSLTEITAQSLYEAADKYDIKDLKDECSDFLVRCIRIDNSIHLLIWAHLHSVDKIQKIVLDFMATKAREISKLDDWVDFLKNYSDLAVLATRRMFDKGWRFSYDDIF